MPVFAALAVISAVAGAAQAVQGLGAQASNRKEIKERNEAASLANVEVGRINDKVGEEVKDQNAIIRADVKAKNEIISSTNTTLTDINLDLISLNEQTNDALRDSNFERNVQVGLANDQASVISNRTRRQVIREEQILRGQTLNSAANSGASLNSSGVQGGLGSLSSQLADTLGFAAQDSAIAKKSFESSQREQEAIQLAQELGFDTSLANLKALEVQRKAETDLALQQNSANLEISKSNNRINELNRKADRIKEEANLDPGKFVDSRENQLSVLNRKIDEANNKGELQYQDSDGAFLTKLPDGGIKRTFASGLVIKRRANGNVTSVSPDGVKTVTKPDGTVTTSKVDVNRIENVIAKVKPLVDARGSNIEPAGGGGF
jgi:hypothetical protein